MAYRLTRRRPLANELACIVAKEFENALDQVTADSARRVEADTYTRRLRVSRRSEPSCASFERNLDKRRAFRTGSFGPLLTSLAPLRDVDATLENHGVAARLRPAAGHVIYFLFSGPQQNLWVASGSGS
jgi:hypothetical protein